MILPHGVTSRAGGPHRRTLRWASLVAAAASGGCSYFANRANDLLDPFQFAVGVGPGMYADVRATDFAATGLGYRDMTAVGTLGRYLITDADMFSFAAGFVVSEVQTIHGAHAVLPGDPSQPDPLLWSAMQLLIVLPMGAGPCDLYSLSERGLHMADIRAGVGLGYLGLDVGFSPGQFVDLLLGVVGIDIAGDDVFGNAAVRPADTTQPAAQR